MNIRERLSGRRAQYIPLSSEQRLMKHEEEDRRMIRRAILAVLPGLLLSITALNYYAHEVRNYINVRGGEKMELLESIEAIFQLVVQYGILLLECVGVTILLTTAIKSIWGILRRDISVRLTLAKGIALALEFKLGGEVLRTVIVREWSELAILGAVIVLRGALTFLIHWEIKTEEASLK